MNGGPERTSTCAPGWNRIPIGASALRTLRLRVKAVTTFFVASQGGLDEVRIPGVDVRESLRLPTDLAATARPLDLSRNELAVVLERTTADDPYRAGNDVGDAQAGSGIDMVDAEPGIRRRVSLPARAHFVPGRLGERRPVRPDPSLDRLAGLPSGWTFESSSRFEGVPVRRASSAFDGDPGTAWVADTLPRRYPWISWQTPRPLASGPCGCWPATPPTPRRRSSA